MPLLRDKDPVRSWLSSGQSAEGAKLFLHPQFSRHRFSLAGGLHHHRSAIQHVLVQRYGESHGSRSVGSSPGQFQSVGRNHTAYHNFSAVRRLPGIEHLEIHRHL